MEHYAAIDVSLEWSSICIVDPSGRIVREAKVRSEREAVVDFFQASGLTFARIGLEAGPLSQWLHAGLVKAGLPAICIETRHVKAALKAMTVKTDKNDARGIAQLMRLGWFRPVRVKTLVAQEIRALLTARRLLLAKLCDLETSLRGILRDFGLGTVFRGDAACADEVPEHLAELVRRGKDRQVALALERVQPRVREGRRDLLGGGECHETVLAAVGDQHRHSNLSEQRHHVLARVGVEEAQDGLARAAAACSGSSAPSARASRARRGPARHASVRVRDRPGSPGCSCCPM